jgi:hypothetical protein
MAGDLSSSLKGAMAIDLNHDGADDLVYSHSWYHEGPGGDLDSMEIQPLTSIFISCILDTMERGNGFYCSPGYFPVARAFLNGETLIDSSTGIWQNVSTAIFVDASSASGFYYCRLGLVQWTTPVYFFLKMITNTDTLLGYIHVFKDTILDYAIQGPQAYYNLTSVNSPALKNIELYPIPCKNQFMILADDYIGYNLYDLSGQALLSGSTKVVNTAKLPQGPYIIMLKTREGPVFKQIVKQD